MALKNMSENSARDKLKKKRKRNYVFPSFIRKHFNHWKFYVFPWIRHSGNLRRTKRIVTMKFWGFLFVRNLCRKALVNLEIN